MDHTKYRPQDLGDSGSRGESFCKFKRPGCGVLLCTSKPRTNFIEEWATTHAVPTVDTLRGWWEELEKFKVKKDQEYQVAGLKKVYKLVAAMLCRMYGHPDAATSSCSWVSLMYFVTINGTHFNWASLLIVALKKNIFAALAPEEGYPSEFYMASYLLDAVYARCHF